MMVSPTCLMSGGMLKGSVHLRDAGQSAKFIVIGVTQPFAVTILKTTILQNEVWPSNFFIKHENK